VCGRYVSTRSLEEIAAALDVSEVRTDPLPARYNVAPSQPVYVVASGQAADGTGPCRQLGAMRWGLVPSFAKSASGGARMINARAESVATSPAFRAAFVRRRCVVPADGFWEWQAAPGEARRARRQPYAIRRSDGGLLALAGVWETWRDPAEPAAAPLRSVAILTTSANAALAPVHERMPVVLTPDALDVWLDPGVEDRDLLQGLLAPAPAQGWQVYPVGPAVGSVANDGPGLLEPL